jgi:phosphoribosyl 1,2-cyclic phosphodiesterase
MHVRVWGARGSIPTPGSKTAAFGGNTSCVQVTGDDGTELILDAGSGIRELGTELFGRRRRLHVLLTHLHLDHIQGLLFFAPMFDADAQVTVWGPPGRIPLRKRLARYLSSPLSPIEIRDLPAQVTFQEVPAGGWRLDEFAVRAALVAHRGPTLGYRVEQSGASLCYLPDHEPGLGANLAAMPPGWISGLGLARGATALIHDSQYTDEEYPSRRGWGHSSLSDSLAFAQRAQPKSLMLFHHDPGHDDERLRSLEEQGAEDAAHLGIEAQVQLAREGEAFDV